MNKSNVTIIVTSAVLVGALTVLSLPFWIDARVSAKQAEAEYEYEYGDREDYEHETHFRALNNEAWRSECGDCHVAYPPAMLPASSWRALMAGLEDHFGVDASLDAQTQAEIAAFLAQNAGREPPNRDSLPVLRISETRWFRHEHQDELPLSIWQHPEVRSPANCEACHTQAEQGDYDEDKVRVPR